MVICCARCGMPFIAKCVLDNEDKNKGLLVDQTWQGSCEHCKYDYRIRVVKKEDADGTTTNS